MLLRSLRLILFLLVLIGTIHVAAEVTVVRRDSLGAQDANATLIKDNDKENDVTPTQSKPINKLQKHVQLQSKKGSDSAFGTNTHQNPETNSAAACSSLAERIPWSQASREERLAFVKAQYCLTQRPGKWSGDEHMSNSIHEDFVLLHAALYPNIHKTASLLVAHRLFVNVYFFLMQRQCGYTGRALYFDFWTYGDQGTVFDTPEFWSQDYYGVFDSNNPNGGTFGLFDNYRVRYVTNDKLYDKFYYINRPLQRHFKSTIGDGQIPYANYLTSKYVRQVLRIKNYDDFRHLLEATSHQYMHGFHGGDTIPSTSTNTPFFWQIHLSVDALYSAWQEQDNGSRRFLYGGPRADKTPASIKDTCVMLKTWSSDYNVEDMLDTRTKPNCYKYTFPDNLQIK